MKQHGYKSECILGGMILLQLLVMFFPNILPYGTSEVLLCIGLLSYFLCKLDAWDHAIKRKYH